MIYQKHNDCKQQPFKDKNIKVSEREIENEILFYLKKVGVFAWKNDSIGVFDAKKGKFRKPQGRYHLNGVSDIVGILNGRALFIEVKRPQTKLQQAGRPSKTQLEFLKKASENGAIAILAWGLCDVIEQIRELVSVE